MNILIASAGRRVSLVRFFKKELSKISHSGKVYTTDLLPELSPACQVSDLGIKVRKITETGAVQELVAICKKYNIQLVIPTIDTELIYLAKHKDDFLKVGAKVVISDESFVAKCRDKRLTNRLFTNLKIDIPKSINLQTPTFPIFAKPYDGSLSKDNYIINNEDELIADIVKSPKLMFMEYLNPSVFDEYTVDIYYGKDHYLKCAVPRKRLEVRTGEVNKALTCKNEIYNFVISKMNFIEGAIGCLTVQFFMSKNADKFYGIEINPRFGGGYPLSYHAGANYPKFILNEWLLNETFSFYDGWENNLLMLRYDDEIIVSDFNG